MITSIIFNSCKEIGRLYPQKVGFIEYDYYKEHFLVGKYIEIQRDNHELIELTTRF